MLFLVWIIGAVVIVRICADTMEKQENDSTELDRE
jgi:hypothetical protein